MEELLFTVLEVAKILKVDQHKVYSLIDKGLLRGLKLGRIKVTRMELFKFLKEYNGKNLSNLDRIVDL